MTDSPRGANPARCGPLAGSVLSHHLMSRSTDLATSPFRQPTPRNTGRRPRLGAQSMTQRNVTASFLAGFPTAHRRDAWRRHGVLRCSAVVLCTIPRVMRALVQDFWRIRSGAALTSLAKWRALTSPPGTGSASLTPEPRLESQSGPAPPCRTRHALITKSAVTAADVSRPCRALFSRCSSLSGLLKVFIATVCPADRNRFPLPFRLPCGRQTSSPKTMHHGPHG